MTLLILDLGFTCCDSFSWTLNCYKIDTQVNQRFYEFRMPVGASTFYTLPYNCLVSRKESRLVSRKESRQVVMYIQSSNLMTITQNVIVGYGSMSIGSYLLFVMKLHKEICYTLRIVGCKKSFKS